MFNEDHAHNPQKTLWQAVLLRAVDDALLGAQGIHRHHLRVLEIETARNWLTTPSEGLAMVCHLAGFDPRAIMEHMRERIAAAPSAEELAATHKTRLATTLPQSKRKAIRERAPQFYELNGETLHVNDWASRAGVSPSTIRDRISRGWPLGDALTMPAAKAMHRARKTSAQHLSATMSHPGRVRPEHHATRTAARYEHDGENLTLGEWAERSGIKKQTIYKRIRLGMTIAEALNPKNLRGKSLQERIADERATQ